MRKHLYTALLIGVFLLAFFLRFNRFWDIPFGLNQDESAIGYNAYAILQTGKDEWGQPFPLYFRSFGDYKLPVYIYLTAGSIKLFGVNEFAVRFPSVLAGTLTVIALYFLVLALSKNKWLSLLAAFFLSINPWHLFFSRAAFEDNVALFFATCGTLLFVKALETKKQFIFFVLAIFSFVLSIYSYNVTRLLVPMLGIFLVFLFRKKIHVSKAHLVGLGIFLLFLLLPFIITFFSRAGAVSAKGALITSTDIIAKSIEMKTYLRSVSRVLGVLVFNKYLYTPWQYVQNIAGFLSPSFFFISGTEHGTEGIGNFGVFYLYEFPFIVGGILLFFKKKFESLKLFFAWFVITLLVASLSKEVPHATRGYFLVIPLTVFSAYGCYQFLYWKNTTKKIALSLLLIFIAGYGYVNYFVSYYLRFPVVYAKEWRPVDKTLVAYLRAHESSYDTIIIDPDTGFRYTSLLFYGKVPPSEFLKTVHPSPVNSEGLTFVRSFGKYQIRNINWSNDYKLDKTLIIAQPALVNKEIQPIQVINFPERPVVISSQEQVFVSIEKEDAYAIVTSDPTKNLFK